MERKVVEVSYQDHCDDECGLGGAFYVCPHCQAHVLDYRDGWWGRYESKEFDCAECDGPLERSY
jgi:hypothetical protein